MLRLLDFLKTSRYYRLSIASATTGKQQTEEFNRLSYLQESTGKKYSTSKSENASMSVYLEQTHLHKTPEEVEAGECGKVSEKTQKKQP